MQFYVAQRLCPQHGSFYVVEVPQPHGGMAYVIRLPATRSVCQAQKDGICRHDNLGCEAVTSARVRALVAGDEVVAQ